MTDFAIGVDLGGTNLRIAAVEACGKILEKITTGANPTRGCAPVIDEMCTAIAALSAKHSPAGRLAGIGVGIPGIIDLTTGMLRESPNLPGWQDYPVRQEIERRLGATVVLENDANCAALGEKWLGAAASVDSMCMVTLGTGVGGGMVLNGRIWHGMLGMAGELGHINVEREGPPCGCGSRGCLEQYSSAVGIKRMAAEAVAAGRSAALAEAMNNNQFNPQAVYEIAMQGDPAAQQIFDRFGRALGIALAGLINIFNLPMYVVGGGVSSAWAAFAPIMLETARSYSYIYRVTAPGDPKDAASPSTNHTLITRAALGSDAGLIGAARLPMTEKTSG